MPNGDVLTETEIAFVDGQLTAFDCAAFWDTGTAYAVARSTGTTNADKSKRQHLRLLIEIMQMLQS